MKKKLLLILLITFNVAFSQTPNWTWAKNVSLAFNFKINMTAVDNQGNVYLAGDFSTPSITIAGTTLTNGSDPGFADAYIFKFTSDGNLIWSKQISTNKNESITSITTDNNGNLYILGTVGNSITLGTSVFGSLGAAYIAKLSSNGNYVWAINNTGNNESFSMKDIKTDNNGNVFVLGELYGTSLTFGSIALTPDPTNPASSNYSVFIFKFNSAGNSQWAKMNTSDEVNLNGTAAKSMAIDTSGGIAICGYFGVSSIHFGNITLTRTNLNGSNMFVAKYNNDGDVMWAYNAGSIYQNNTTACGIATDVNDNVYVGGAYPNSIQFGTTTLTSFSGAQMFLAKYTSNGTFQWAKTTDYPTNGYSKIKSITTDSSSNVYVVGNTYASTISFGSNVNLNNLGTVGAFFVTKYDTQGTPIWAKGVTNIDANNDVAITCRAENDLFIAGSFDKSTLQLGTTLTKSASNFDLFLGRLYLAPLSNYAFDSKEMVLYPNPANEFLTITNLNHEYQYEIYDTLGKLLQKGSYVNQQESMDVSSLKSGLYIINLKDSEGKTFQKKFTIK